MGDDDESWREVTYWNTDRHGQLRKTVGFTDECGVFVPDDDDEIDWSDDDGE